MKPNRIEQHTDYPWMYWVVWPDGVKSQWPYNKDRASDILKHYDQYVASMKLSKDLTQNNRAYRCF